MGSLAVLVTLISVLLAYRTLARAYVGSVHALGGTSPAALDVLAHVPLSDDLTQHRVSVRAFDRTRPIVIFLHDGPCRTRLPRTRTFPEPPTELLERFVIVEYDRRGCGDSYGEPAESIGHFDTAKLVDDVADLCRRMLAVIPSPPEAGGVGTRRQSKVFLAGEGWGAYLAVEVAAAHPELVHGAVAMALPAYMAAEPAEHAPRRKLDPVSESASARAARAAASLATVPATIALATQEKMLLEATRKTFGNTTAARDLARVGAECGFLAPLPGDGGRSAFSPPCLLNAYRLFHGGAAHEWTLLDALLHIASAVHAIFISPDVTLGAAALGARDVLMRTQPLPYTPLPVLREKVSVPLHVVRGGADGTSPSGPIRAWYNVLAAGGGKRLSEGKQGAGEPARLSTGGRELETDVLVPLLETIVAEAMDIHYDLMETMSNPAAPRSSPPDGPSPDEEHPPLASDDVLEMDGEPGMFENSHLDL